MRPFEALHLFLEAARERLGVRTLTLSAPTGHLIAGVGADVERVAELGARVDANVATWRTRVGDGEVVLTSSGRAMSADLADGVRRILGA